jgi:hypothetical protein
LYKALISQSFFMKKTVCFFLTAIIFYSAAAQNPVPYLKKNGKYIFVDSASMKPLWDKEYFSASPFQEGLAKVQVEEKGKIFFIDKTGAEKILLTYDNVIYFRNGLCRVTKNNKYGFIDTTGKEIVPCKYDGAHIFFTDGLSKVTLDKKDGFIDVTGKEVIPCTLENVSLFAEGMAAINQGGKWGFINKTGKLVIPAIYEYQTRFAGGLAVVLLNGKWGVIDKKGRTIILPKYSSAALGVFPDFLPAQLITVAIDDNTGKKKFGCINKTGKVIIPLKYDLIKYVTNNVMLMKQGEIISLVNNKNITIKTFDNFSDFKVTEGGWVWLKQKEGLRGGGKWSLFDAGGKEITPSLRFEESSSFSAGLAPVKLRAKWGMINTKGKMVIMPKYDGMYYIGMWNVKTGGKQLLFYIDHAGREYYEQ